MIVYMKSSPFQNDVVIKRIGKNYAKPEWIQLNERMWKNHQIECEFSTKILLKSFQLKTEQFL